MKSIFTTVFMSTLMICSTSTFAKEYYKWVDSKGSTHYTTTPPPKTAKKHGKIDTYGYYNSTPTPAPAATNTTTQTTQQNQQGTQPAPATTTAQQVPVNNVNQPANTVNENNALKEESRLVDK